MSLRDRLRETAQQAQETLAKGAQQAQEGLAKGQAKLEQLQNRSPANDQLVALGQAYWVVQSGRATDLQLEALLGAVRPAILEVESRSGPLPWPVVPVAAGPAAGPASPAPPFTVTVSDPEPSVAGPVGAPTTGPASSSIPTAIHHDAAD